MIYRNMHHAEARAPFLESSFGRDTEACSADPVFYGQNEDFVDMTQTDDFG